MAHIMIKSDNVKKQEQKILQQFGGSGTAEQREYAECIAARTREAVKNMDKDGGRLCRSLK